MKLGLNLSIDVTKIDKSRIFEGKKGKYLDLTTFIDLGDVDQYGNNGFISQSTTKEERQNNVQTPILGNVKVFFNDSSSEPTMNKAQGNPQQSYQNQQPQQQAPSYDFDDNVPFR